MQAMHRPAGAVHRMPCAPSTSYTATHQPLYIKCSRAHTITSLSCLGPSKRTLASHAVVCHASKSTISSSLISVLKDELKYARESYRKDEQLLEGPPNDFELDNPPGKKVFYLLKEYKQEQIIIEVDLDAQPAAKDEEDEDEIPDDDDDDEDEAEEVPPVAFKVQINKDGGCMTFECESNGEYVVIMDLAMEPDASDEEEEDEELQQDEPYTGPVFEDLDDTLQQAFLDYLEERGVTAELGEFIRLLAADKSSMEYQMWLQQVCDFVAQ